MEAQVKEETDRQKTAGSDSRTHRSTDKRRDRQAKTEQAVTDTESDTQRYR